MQQYFINEIQKKIIPDMQATNDLNSPYFFQQIENFNLPQLEYYIQQCSANIQETNDQKCWIYLGLLLKCVLTNKNNMTVDQYNRFAINTFVQLIQILNIHFTSNYIEQLLQTYYDIIDRVDDQFWIFLAWQFRNAANNLHQLELLKYLVIRYKEKKEFLDIFTLKVKIEFEKPVIDAQVHQVLISSLQFILNTNPEAIIQPSLFQYIISILSDFYLQVPTKDLYFVIGLIDLYFEKQHFSKCRSASFETFTTYIFQFLLNQIESVNHTNQTVNKEIQKENYKLFTRLCHNYYALKLFSQNSDKILNIIYTQLTNYIELYNAVKNDDTNNELIDLISKQDSDTYLCSIVRLFVTMCKFVRQFSYYGFLFCSQVFNLIFNTSSQDIDIVNRSIKFVYETQDIEKMNFIIMNNKTLQITQLQASMILLASIKSIIVRQSFLLHRFEQLLRIHLTNLASQTSSNNLKIIFMLFFGFYQKKIFHQPSDEEYNIQFIQYILQEILSGESEIAIRIFNKITKFPENFSLLQSTIQSLNPALIKIISTVDDAEFYISLINLATVHKSFFELYSEGYLIALQERILFEITNNQNFHLSIKMLQAYSPILKIFPQEASYNSKLNIFKLIESLPYSKKQCYDEPIIEICKIYLKYNCNQIYNVENRTQYNFVLTFVFEQLNLYIQQPSYIKLLASLTTHAIDFLEDELPLHLLEIFKITLQCIKINYMPKKVRVICRNLALNTQILFRESFMSLIEQHLQTNLNSSFFLICYLCISDQERTEKFHVSLIDYMLNIKELDINSKNQSEIFDCSLMLIKLFVYTNENYGKIQDQFIKKMFLKLIDLLHACLLIDDKENQEKKMNPVYNEFQELIHKLDQHYLNSVFFGLPESLFKMEQLMEARAQFGLVNIIYHKFKN